MSIRIATALAVALCALPLLAHGEDGEGSDSLAYKANEQAARPLAPRGPTTVEEMEAFVDGFMDAQMKSGPIAGAAVVVVKDGQVFFQKGYGYEDTEKRTPVDPAQTLFRPGSVSKLFTWTAIMQLVEQGKIDLDADVNTYLKDFKVDATFPEPVKVRNIMTHTGGFEDGGVGYLFAGTAEDLLPLGEWLAAHQPARVRPPTTDFSDGTNASYSNWATALGGHIVEVVSGQSFDDYIEQHIFQPLGMERSTFREPLPEPLAPRMSGGYTLRSGRVQVARLRVHPRRRPRRVDDFDRRGHGALHARALAGRRTGRRAHPQAGNGAADAQARDEPGRGAERPRARLLRNVHQRSPHHRSRRRHAVFPLGAEPDAGNRHRPVRDGEHRRPWRQNLGRARARFLQALLSRGAAGDQAAR